MRSFITALGESAIGIRRPAGRDPLLRLPALFAAIACLCAGWMLLGIRHTGSDDLLFDLFANDPAIGLGQATLWTALRASRFSHLVNVPLAELTLRIVDTPVLGDVAILGQIAIIIGGAAVLLRRIAGTAAASGWIMLMAGGYALHWYFMPPLAYPLHALNSALLLVLSLLALSRYAARGGRLWLALSLACSAIGILWPEFNFLLFPGATMTAIILLSDGWRGRVRLALPFCGVWAACVLFSLAFRLLAPHGHDTQRMTLALDPAAWAEAFGILLRQGLLPAAMLHGIDQMLPDIPGMPHIPRRLDFAVLWSVVRTSAAGFSLVLLAWTGAFAVVLRDIKPSRKAGLWFLLATGAVLLVVPLAVVASSRLYQNLLAAGYIQGAVATAYAQAGFLTMVFAAAALLALRWPFWPVRGLLALGLGALCVMTLAYNLLSRDLMAANQQRWAAFALLAEALPDGARLSAPSLWLPAGVSAIPTELPFGLSNYWTERARIWHGKDIAVDPPGALPEPADARAAYGVRPDGEPIVLLRDAAGAQLLSAHPRKLDPLLTAGASWHCAAICRLDLPADTLPAAEARLLGSPDGIRSPDLAAWFLQPRGGAFGWR